MFPKIVNLKETLDDMEDAIPPLIGLAKRRLSTFFADRLAKLEQSRANFGAMRASGLFAARYGEAGECSGAKTQRLNVLEASGEVGLGQASYSCRTLDTWLTSHLEPSGASYVPAFRVVYIGRGVSPCARPLNPSGIWSHPNSAPRTRCTLNSGEIVDMLDSLGILLSSSLEGESLYDLSASSRAIVRRGRGCVHVNHELNTHTFLETVDIMRSVSMIVSVQGSQLFDAIFAKQEVFLIEMVPTHETRIYVGDKRAESNRIFYSSLGMRTAILPIYGAHKFDDAPFAIDPCRLVRLVAQMIDAFRLQVDVFRFSCEYQMRASFLKFEGLSCSFCSFWMILPRDEWSARSSVLCTFVC